MLRDDVLIVEASGSHAERDGYRALASRTLPVEVSQGDQSNLLALVRAYQERER